MRCVLLNCPLPVPQDPHFVMTAMQAQIPKQDALNSKSQEEMTDEDWDKLVSPAHWETIRKLK